MCIRDRIPPAPSPFKARTAAGANGAGAATANQSGAGSGGFKVGDTVRVLIDGWQEATVLEVHGRSYLVHLPNGINVSKLWPYEVHRLGRLTEMCIRDRLYNLLRPILETRAV